MPQCCICKKELPNRYAIAGECEMDGCGALFCTYHWHNGNHRCKEHGWQEHNERNETMENENKMSSTTSEKEIRSQAKINLTIEQSKGIVQSTLDFAAKLGKSATALAMKIKNANSPETMLATIDASLEAGRTQRAPLVERAETLYTEIAKKKKVYQVAPPARKRILELELKSLLSEYKGIERQLTAYFENENTLNVVRGRVLELMARGLNTLREKDIDKLTDRIADAVDDAEDIKGAVKDLDGIGSQGDSESDHAAFEDALAGFEEYDETAGMPSIGDEGFEIKSPSTLAAGIAESSGETISPIPEM